MFVPFESLTERLIKSIEFRLQSKNSSHLFISNQNQTQTNSKSEFWWNVSTLFWIKYSNCKFSRKKTNLFFQCQKYSNLKEIRWSFTISRIYS